MMDNIRVDELENNKLSYNESLYVIDKISKDLDKQLQDIKNFYNDLRKEFGEDNEIK